MFVNVIVEEEGANGNKTKRGISNLNTQSVYIHRFSSSLRFVIRTNISLFFSFRPRQVKRTNALYAVNETTTKTTRNDENISHNILKKKETREKEK